MNFGRTYWLALLCIRSFAHSEDPWGNDAALCTGRSAPQSPQCPSPVANIGIGAIRFHQTIISPADGPRSHFFPSSSQYALEAIQEHGFLHGVVIGCDRLMRENNDPWIYRTIQLPGGALKADLIPKRCRPVLE